MIPFVEEPKEHFEVFGFYENCFFCPTPTKYWHWRTNQPICKKCSKERKVSELPKSSPLYKPCNKKEYLNQL